MDRAAPNECIHNLFALPVKLGGLRIPSPHNLTSDFENSFKVCAPLINQISAQNKSYSDEVWSEQMLARTCTSIHHVKHAEASTFATSLRKKLPKDLQYAMDFAQGKGAWSWLTPLPNQEYSFTLHKGAFQDALALYYGWQPSCIPANCPHSTTFTVDHTLACPKGDSHNQA